MNWQCVNQLSSYWASNYGYVTDEQRLIADELLAQSFELQYTILNIADELLLMVNENYIFFDILFELRLYSVALYWYLKLSYVLNQLRHNISSFKGLHLTIWSVYMALCDHIRESNKIRMNTNEN